MFFKDVLQSSPAARARADKAIPTMDICGMFATDDGYIPLIKIYQDVRLINPAITTPVFQWWTLQDDHTRIFLAYGTDRQQLLYDFILSVTSHTYVIKGIIKYNYLCISAPAAEPEPGVDTDSYCYYPDGNKLHQLLAMLNGEI